MPRANRHSVEEFAAVFRAVSRRAREPVVLVGGHAVNAWALAYKARLGPALREFLPLTAGHMDVVASRTALLALHRELGGRLLLSGPRDPTEGTLVIGAEPHLREIDVLRAAPGAGRAGAGTVLLRLCGHEVPVLFPHLLLQAKLAKALTLDQAGRQDVKHVRVLTLVLREFLAEVARTAAPADSRAAALLLRDARAVASSPEARRFAERHGGDLSEALPQPALLDLEAAQPA